jgi:hypothetical protein
MSTSQSSGSVSQPGQNPALIAIAPELADRLVAALELIGATHQDGGRRDDLAVLDGQPDPTRERTARDHDVLRGLLGRADAPRPLRMHRQKSTGGGPGPGKGHTSGGNVLTFPDEVPPTARFAVVESLVQGSDPLRERVEIPKPSAVRLELTTITATKPISRVEIFDANSRLVAFGPSAGPVT